MLPDTETATMSTEMKDFGDWRRPINERQASFDGLGWKKWQPGEQEAYLKADAAQAKVTREELHKAEEKKRHENALGAARSKKYQMNKKARADDTETDESVLKKSDANSVLMQGADAMVASSKKTLVPDAAKVSCLGKEEWRLSRNGTCGGAVQSKATRMNYYHPYVWCHIDRKMHQMGWSSAATAKALQHDFPVLFAKLNKGTIQQWKVKGENRWSDRALLNVKNHSVLESSGCAGILTPYPDTINEINTALHSLCTSGIPVNISIGRSIIWAVISEHHPELLKNFKILEHWVHLYYESNLKWSSCKAT